MNEIFYKSFYIKLLSGDLNSYTALLRELNHFDLTGSKGEERGPIYVTVLKAERLLTVNFE